MPINVKIASHGLTKAMMYVKVKSGRFFGAYRSGYDIRRSDHQMKKNRQTQNQTARASALKGLKLGNVLALIMAGVINAVGVMIFLFPVKLYDSGISGLSMLLDQVTAPYLTVSLFLLIFNIPIFIFGMKRQGITFTIYSCIALSVYSLFSYLIERVFPVDVSFISPLAGSDLLLCAIFGGVISGIGSGLTVRFGGAIDGIDVLSVVFARRLGLSIGSFVMVFNFLLYVACGVVLNSWVLPLYSIITYFVASKTIDYIVDGFDRVKCAMIVTTEADRITEELSKSFKSSGTIVNAIGGYSKSERQIVYFIVNHFQVNKLKTIVHEIDRGAFVSLQEVSDVIHQKEY